MLKQGWDWFAILANADTAVALYAGPGAAAYLRSNGTAVIVFCLGPLGTAQTGHAIQYTRTIIILLHPG